MVFSISRSQLQTAQGEVSSSTGSRANQDSRHEAYRLKDLGRIAVVALTWFTLPACSERQRNQKNRDEQSNGGRDGNSLVSGSSNHAPLTIQIHTVKAGESLWRIASLYSPDPQELERTIEKINSLNGLSSDTIHPGQKLRVPSRQQPTVETYTVTEGDTLRSVAREHNMSVGLLMRLNQLTEDSQLTIGASLRVLSPVLAESALASPLPQGQRLSTAEIRDFMSTLDEDFGSLCRALESNNNASAHSQVAVDPGGASYGCYQISQSTMPSFIKHLKEATSNVELSEERQKVASKAHESLRDLDPTSKDFRDTWIALAKHDPIDFRGLQHDFILQTHLLPVLTEANKLGFAITPEMAEVYLSIGVQHAGFGSILDSAAKQLELPSASPDLQVEALYRARSRYVQAIRDRKLTAVEKSDQSEEQKKAESAKVSRFWNSVLKRYQTEERMAKSLLQEGNG